jgi:bifunctional non-homologous end joining protein LigD
MAPLCDSIPKQQRRGHATAGDCGCDRAHQGEELHCRRRGAGAGPVGLSRFDDLRRREAAHKATLYAFDLIEHDGQDLRDLPFLDRKAALARLLRDTEAGILLNEHIAEDGMTVFAHAFRLGAEGIVSKRVDGTCRSGPCAVWIKVRNPASIAVQWERSEKWNR